MRKIVGKKISRHKICMEIPNKVFYIMCQFLKFVRKIERIPKPS